MEKHIDEQKKKQVEKAAQECAAEIAKTMDWMAESMNSPDGEDLCVQAISIPIGEVDGKPRYVQIQVQARKSNGYEAGIDREIVDSVQWWPQLAVDARKGAFDEEVFCDMASFAFDDLVKSARKTLSRGAMRTWPSQSRNSLTSRRRSARPSTPPSSSQSRFAPRLA